MNIQGLQKLTMLDFPGHTACTVFTGGCNLRCPFCHNVPLVLDPEGEVPFSDEEIFSLLEKRRGILDGVAITGGEPLVQKDIADFCAKVKDMGFLVKLDSNGAFPGKLRELIENGLVDYVAMDIKNCKEKYPLTCGREKLDIAPFEESVSLLMEGRVGFEFRTTVVKEFHTCEDIERIAQWIEGAPRYFLQNFKDSGNLICENLHAPERETLTEMLAAAREKIPAVGLRGTD